MSIAGAGLNRYNQYKENTNKLGWNNVLTDNQPQEIPTGIQNMPWQPSQSSPSISQSITMAVPNYSTPSNIFNQSGALQMEMDDYFSNKSVENSAQNLGIDNQIVLGGVD